MIPEYIQRHHDYELTLTSVPSGGIHGVELPLDTDAAFALGLVRQRATPTASVANISYRFRLPRGAYQSDQFRNDAFGQGVQRRGNSIYPAVVYPAGGTIVFDIQNNSGGTVTNVKILCRGRKLYAPGTINIPQWPKRGEGRVSPFPYVYPITISGIVQSNGNANMQNQIVIKDDADFVLRCGFADSASLTAGYVSTYDQLYIRLYDKWRQYYSNEPIHIDDVFGPSSAASAAAGGGNVVQYAPNLFAPEIYIPANDPLYFDLFRTDAAGGTVTLQIGFVGMKVFRR